MSLAFSGAGRFGGIRRTAAPAPASGVAVRRGRRESGPHSSARGGGPAGRGPGSGGPDSSGPDSSGPDSSGPDSSGPDSSGPDFGRRTHRWDDWSLAGLLAAKEATGQAVSLVVPARNEAATVGAVVSRVRTALMETVSLLDEIVVIDSDSEDRTFAVAADAGAVVHRSRDIRPDLGTRPGKGEAMWKSLFVTRGDILVFMDADLVDWDTHFVPGLLGPLLTANTVALVKGFYERPFGGEAQEGGRVTELVARPLIALYFPELAGLAQPLAGEWAVRRSLFETLPVPTGYAVELAALIDTARALGTEAIAQVHLGRRGHRHQSLRDLGAMAAQVMAAGMARATGKPSADAVQLLQHMLVDGAPAGHARQVPLTERPPARWVG
jgi:glucosyl-3-phosphoglycerate synthase